MPKLVHSTPRYRRHKGSNQAVVELGGRVFYLGKWNTKASKREFDRIVSEWLARDRQPLVESNDLTIAELSARYWTYTKKRHPEASPRRFHVKGAMRHLLKLYRDRLAVQFGPLELKVVREQMIGANWSRSYINSQTRLIVAMFKWAAGEAIISSDVFRALEVIEWLRKGEARETDKIACVAEAGAAAF